MGFELTTLIPSGTWIFSELIDISTIDILYLLWVDIFLGEVTVNKLAVVTTCILTDNPVCANLFKHIVKIRSEGQNRALRLIRACRRDIRDFLGFNIDEVFMAI